MATVLIIYYKQITEGYEDQFRFEIMQNVGMSRREVKNTIKSQVLSVFYFTPWPGLCPYGICVPNYFRILKLLQMTNITLFIWGMIATVAVFTHFFYTVIYVLTAQVYYKIVSAKSRKAGCIESHIISM